MNKIITTLLVTICCTNINAQDRITPEQYIEQFKNIAIEEMNRTGVPAAITLAQGLLETESGNGVLVKKSNNHFGIKCKSTWTGATVSYNDDAIGECFRVYNNANDSYRDHSDFLKQNARYGFLFSIDANNYKAWADGLKKAGYATNPKYPQLLIKFIEQYNLQQYTLLGNSTTPVSTYANFNTTSSNIIVATIEPSDNVIKVNNRNCIYAAKGTSLLAIATTHDVSLKKLLNFNELTQDGLLETNQYIFLEKKSKTGEHEFYITQQGESLIDIAQKNGIQLKNLLDYNRLWGNEELKAGIKLLLQPSILK